MSKRKKQLEEFFTRYETQFNDSLAGKGDIRQVVVSAFAECFVESSAAGVMCGRNDDKFVDMLKQGIEFYKTIGTKEMHIVSKDITQIDDYHSMAKVYWRYGYTKDGQEGTVDFHTFYLLNTASGEPKIFAYMAGDEQRVLKEKGLVLQEEAVEQ